MNRESVGSDDMAASGTSAAVPSKSAWRAFPTRIFVLAVTAVCLALAVSAALSFTSLVGLRKIYLEDRGRAVAQALDDRLRGPGRRDPEMWREAMQDLLESGMDDALRRLTLRRANGEELVVAGARDSQNLYVFEAQLRPRSPQMGGRRGRGGPPPFAAGAPEGFSLEIGLDPSVAGFVARQAWIQLGISVIAILTLAGLAFFFLRTLSGFLDLQAREESQRHLAALGRMSATLAHEIRNPLGAIKGLTQVAQERLPRDHDTQELMQTVVAEAQRLEQLVTDLLTFARPKPVEKVEVDLTRLVCEATETLRERTDEGRIQIVVSPANEPARVLSDPNGLKQVLLNVLINAIDASPAGGKVTVRIGGSKESARLEIEDQGSGLGQQSPEELFQPFTTTKLKGTGLGLPISRQIVERLGGQISLSNRPEGGALCGISLPGPVKFGKAGAFPG